MPRIRPLVVTLALILLSLALTTPVAAQSASPFVDPPFAPRCTVRHFGEGEAPPLTGFPDDPLCVEYQKRDITLSNGGAIRFLAAEPARFAIAIPKCRYWQQDHWRIQPSLGDPTIVQWDGSYWFSKGDGNGGARLRNFAIGGQPASPEQVADLVAPLDPMMADVIRTFGNGPDDGGGGAAFCLGFSDPTCAGQPVVCGDAPCGACTVANARDAIDAACDCDAAPSRAAYRQCVRAAADAEVAAGRLGADCRDAILQCASRSTCGRPGAVTCCRTSKRGTTTCSIKKGADRCRAPAGGSACAGAKASCCDACAAGGCRVTPAPCG